MAIVLNGSTGISTPNIDNGGAITATSVIVGTWNVTETSGVLLFSTGGVDKMKLDASGNLTVVGDVTAFGTV
tara:strand:+ start:339 stop:554 length:216 start_codon:yes stop_codon:yes gene_type:complete